MQQSRAAICTAIRSTNLKTSCRGFARIRTREAPINPKSEASLAAAAARAQKKEQLSADAEDHSSESSGVPFAETPFFAKASKIISDMSLKTANSTSTSIKEGELEENNSWNWVPPRDGAADTAEIIPIIHGVLLTHDEIKEALIAQGGIDVVVVEMREPIESMTHLILASGRSTRHLRKMSDTIVQALRSRKLKQAMGRKGAEGEKDDDWLAVDCFDLVVHFMMPATRKALDLEKHWTEKQPVLHFTENEKLYDERFEAILDHYPIPEDYQVAASDEKVEVTKKQKVTIRRL